VIDPIRAASTSEDDLAQRRALMFVTLRFKEMVRVPPGMEATFNALRSWLNSLRGIGDIETGVRRQGCDPYLCRYDGRGRAGDVLHDRDGAPPDRHHQMIAWLANNTWTAAASC
jgi:hypothetical protein